MSDKDVKHYMHDGRPKEDWILDAVILKGQRDELRLALLKIVESSLTLCDAKKLAWDAITKMRKDEAARKLGGE
jgi:hypothetical protein|tara:strand:- start:225 stop:446 length:222 start_codon:yes stop_codon:yes gene_type:complete